MTHQDRYKALAPAFIRQTYSGTGIPHHAYWPVQPAEVMTPGVNPQLFQADGGDTDFQTAMLAWLDVYAANFAPETTFGICEIYSVDALTGVSTFIDAFTTNVVGTSADEQVPLVQGQFILKCTSGKPLRIFTMEGVYAANAYNPGTPITGARADTVAFLLSGDNVIWGRSNSYPHAYVSFISKVNDKLRRRQGFTDV
jgi:hypothetical protein